MVFSPFSADLRVVCDVALQSRVFRQPVPLLPFIVTCCALNAGLTENCMERSAPSMRLSLSILDSSCGTPLYM